MGRRSINTTKSGKFMNPTDQARKEARKRELKKNKKQRMLVRQAVLKNKDPVSIMSELKSLDVMEFDPINPPPYNVKVLHEKRRKLKETWDRLMRLYCRDDPTKVNELKAMESDYELRRKELCNYYESVIQAQRVKVDDIPLPDHSSSTSMLSYLIAPSEIPLPSTSAPASLSKTQNISQNKPFPNQMSTDVNNVGLNYGSSGQINSAAMAAATAAAAAVVAAKPEIIFQHKHLMQQKKGILKKTSTNENNSTTNPRSLSYSRKPPGPPPGAPPQLSDYDTDSNDSDNDESERRLKTARNMHSKQNKRIRFENIDDQQTAENNIDARLSQLSELSRSNLFMKPVNYNQINTSQPYFKQNNSRTNPSSSHQVISSNTSFYKQQIAMAAATAARNAINRSAVNLQTSSNTVANIDGNNQQTNANLIPASTNQQNSSNFSNVMNPMNFHPDPMIMSHHVRPLLSGGDIMQQSSQQGQMHIMAAQSLQRPVVSQMYQGLSQQLNIGMDSNNLPSSTYVNSSVSANATNRNGIIEAKPQIRNRMASITKLVPTVLKVKRNEGRGEPGQFSSSLNSRHAAYGYNRVGSNRQSTDVAYDAFMKEMENVLK
ncbi:hypothetical protein GJ496_004253 [Pomphorhynchus laevis]|nr:hypothetical protein GJ496_004253 [Pomphorhynchus laevis]